MPTRSITALLAALVLTAGCAGSAGTTTASESAEASPSEASAAGSETVGADSESADSESAESEPESETPGQIVSLSPTATEMLFAIGAGEQVVAVDDQSDFPADVPTTDLSNLEPNVEAVAAYEPDLVVLSGDPGDVEAGLGALGIETLLQPAAVTLDDTYAQLTELGEVTGHPDEAEELVAELRAEVDAIVAAVPQRPEPLTYYHELDDQLYSATSQTFIGEVYALAGLENVADPADPDGEFGGYPQLSAEYLVEADPDMVFLADTECCGQDAATFAARPGFADMTAVRDGNVVELSDDIASRWGPRVVELLRTVAKAAADVPVG